MKKLVLCAAILGMTACARVAPVMEAGGDFGGKASLEQRAEQIRRAGARRGWAMSSQAPGLMRGTLKLRGHYAVVDIPYDTERFTIRYADSRDLAYDGTNVHKKYNDWVRFLELDIIRQGDRDQYRAEGRPAFAGSVNVY